MITPVADIVVETRGGTVVGVYSNSSARVILVDWDEFHDDGRAGVLYPVDPMSKMPSDTSDLVRRAR
jgi:hypothetical protein